MHWSRGLLVVFFYLSPLVDVTESELFTAVSHIEKLVQMEDELADSLEQYLAAQEQRWELLQQFAGEVKHAVEQARKDRSKYLGHPVNAFLLIKRFVREWPEVERRLSQPVSGEETFLDKLSYYKTYFPRQEDMEGALAAIRRLQDVYNFKPSDLTEGTYGGIKNDIGKIMTTMDSYTIGRASYIKKDFQHCTQWMLEALRLLDTRQPDTRGEIAPSRTDVLDHLAFAEYKIGDLKSAINHTKELLKIDPANTRAATNIKFYAAELAKRNTTQPIAGVTAKEQETDYSWLPTLPQNRLKNVDYWIERTVYKKLCRGDKVATSYQDVKKLKCAYLRRSPLCIIKHCQVERVFTNPNIWIFRNLLSAYEIEKIKKISIPLIQRATVHNPITGKLEHAHYRISKSCWLDGSHDELIERINLRFEAFTGLTMKTAEAFQDFLLKVRNCLHLKLLHVQNLGLLKSLPFHTGQFSVQNYGLAGQYAPHFDFSRDLEHSSMGQLGLGNRLATLLVYMSQVEAGGATVFPYVGARLTPSEGDVVFWYNLMKSGEGDFRTRHAGCPVIAGTKWVANKWVHECGNEFRRPCSLNPFE